MERKVGEGGERETVTREVPRSTGITGRPGKGHLVTRTELLGLLGL